MKRFVVALILASTSTLSLASNDQCLSQKYDIYIDASLTWYADLVNLTTAKYPELTEVGTWFLDGRKHHFELNRAAVHYYLKQDPSRVAVDKPIESWLQLEQSDIKLLSSRNDDLGAIAKRTFDDRQAENHEKNYELRSAFADLLSQPKQIDVALTKYNKAVAQAAEIKCH